MSFWTPVVQAAILLLDIFCFGSSYLIYEEQKEVLKNLEKAVKLDVNKNLEKYLEILPNKKIEYAGIRGKVFPLSKETNELPIQDMQDIFEHIKKYGRYILTNPYNSPSKDENTNISFPLTLYSPTDTIDKSLPFTVLVDSVSWGDKFRSRSNAFSGDGVLFYGMRGSQSLAQDGMLITVYGKVIQIGPGEIRIQYTGDDAAPFIFTKSSTEELISTQRYYIKFSRIMLIAFAIMGLAVFGRFVHEEWKKYCCHRRRLQIFKELLPAIIKDEAVNPPDTNLNSDLDLNDEGHILCLICKTTARNTIFACNHISVCEQCAQNLNGMCPVCSKVSERILPAYIS